MPKEPGGEYGGGIDGEGGEGTKTIGDAFPQAVSPRPVELQSLNSGAGFGSFDFPAYGFDEVSYMLGQYTTIGGDDDSQATGIVQPDAAHAFWEDSTAFISSPVRQPAQAPAPIDPALFAMLPQTFIPGPVHAVVDHLSSQLRPPLSPARASPPREPTPTRNNTRLSSSEPSSDAEDLSITFIPIDEDDVAITDFDSTHEQPAAMVQASPAGINARTQVSPEGFEARPAGIHTEVASFGTPDQLLTNRTVAAESLKPNVLPGTLDVYICFKGGKLDGCEAFVVACPQEDIPGHTASSSPERHVFTLGPLWRSILREGKNVLSVILRANSMSPGDLKEYILFGCRNPTTPSDSTGVFKGGPNYSILCSLNEAEESMAAVAMCDPNSDETKQLLSQNCEPENSNLVAFLAVYVGTDESQDTGGKSNPREVPAKNKQGRKRIKGELEDSLEPELHEAFALCFPRYEECILQLNSRVPYKPTARYGAAYTDVVTIRIAEHVKETNTDLKHTDDVFELNGVPASMRNIIVWVGQKPPSYGNNKTVVLGTKAVLDRAIKARASLHLQLTDAIRHALVTFEILFYKYDDVDVYVLPTKEQIDQMEVEELRNLFASFVSCSFFSRDLSIDLFTKYISDAVRLSRSGLRRLMELVKTVLPDK